MSSEQDRARAALWGLALGDALGMPSQTLPREEIRARYGRIIGFVAPYADHPVSHGLIAGTVTDDTEQVMLLAERLIRAPDRFDEAGWVQDLLGWEDDVKRRGLRDLLGPSTKAALEAIAGGASPDEAAKGGTTNGAAMRIAPVGIATPLTDMGRFVDRVEAACRVTHNTGEAIAGAAAVAAVVSAGIRGAAFQDALSAALDACDEGQRRGHPAGESDMTGRIAAALSLAQSGATIERIAEVVGTSVASCESVPAAFALLARAGGDPWAAALEAANIGDDTDTIGAIAGAMGGACSGMSALPEAELAALRAVNELPVERVADALLALRHAGAEA